MKNEEIHKEAVKRYDDSIDIDEDNRELALNDLEFLTNTGDGQWPEDVRREREALRKPCITVNRLPQFLRQVTGDIRKTNPAIRISPSDASGSDDMAKIKGGLVRQIEATSGAQSIYEGAAESAAACGIGNWRVMTRYCHDRTFDQEIYLDGIKNAFSVVWDRAAKLPTRADARYCFITEEMERDEFKRQFPDANATEFSEGDDVNGRHFRSSSDTITVAEYFWKEPVKKRLVMLEDGSVLEDAPKGIKFTRERTVETHKVMWAKLSGHEVLDGPTEMPGKFIPVVACVGEEIHVGENVVRSSVIRYAKEPQQLYNYSRSSQAETIALQPRAPYMVTPDQILGHESIWAQANRANVPYLPYNPDAEAPPPQRTTPPVASQGMMAEIQIAIDDMKAATGIHDASLGGTSNETSGVAIRQRQIEGDIGNSIYVDNLAQSIEHSGRIILDLMPKIYDTNRIIRILGEDGAESMKEINAVIMQDGQQVPFNDFSEGEYAVRVSTGPAYSTMRQEATERMMSFVQAYPQAAPIIGDLIAKGLDFPGAEALAERLKRFTQATMPGVIEDDEDLSPEEQQARAQQQQAMQAQQAKQERMQDIAFQVEMEAKQADSAAKMAGVAEKQANIEAKTAQLQELAAKIENMRSKTDNQDIDTAAKQLDLALKSGLLDAAIQNAVARTLQSVNQ